MSWLLILCEGYDDRNFWSSWLARLGCSSILTAAGEARYGFKKVAKDYWFTSPHGELVVVRPCMSIEFIWTETEREIRRQEPPKRIIVNVDSDKPADEDATSGRIERLWQLVQGLGCKQDKRDLPYRVGDTQIDLVVWHSQDLSGTAGVPDKQTLERLVCAAIVEASISSEHPQGWATSVLTFLQQEPRGGDKHKNYAHAYRAKYLVHEMEELFQAVWSEHFPGIAAQLEKRLRATGAWRVAEALLNPVEDSL